MCLSGRQARWMEYMERFDYSITYIKGECNKVADCFSHYHMSDATDEIHLGHEYVKADIHLDPEGDELPCGRLEEVHTLRVRAPAADQETEREQRPLEPQVDGEGRYETLV